MIIFRRLREYSKFLWSLLRLNIRLLWGMWRLTKFPHPAITIFGGARIPNESIHAKMAVELGKKLAGAGFSIITGGGPGIMEAANQGAFEYLKESKDINLKHPKRFVSAGIGLLKLNLEKSNPYVQENIVMTHFFARKWLLVRYSVGFVIFPGGFGTLDELFEVVTLVQCNRMEKVPVILIDSNYWQPLMDFIKHRAIANNLISPEDEKILSVVDTPQEAFEIIACCCGEKTESVLQTGVEKKP